VSTPHTLFHVKNATAVLTFNRPETRNAMTWDMYDALVQTCGRVDDDPEIRVLVLRGAGGKAFVSGTDIGQFAQLQTQADAIAYERRLDAVCDRLERVTKPTIAQIQGVATGGGCLIALACDLRVCANNAQLGVPIARTLGNCLSAANYARLIDLVGPALTRDLLLTGRLLTVDDARALGLVTVVAEEATIDRVVDELAGVIARNAPLSLYATKEAVRRIRASRPVDPELADDLVAVCYRSADFHEGVTAFLAKRAPRFTGL
jgi:enoyl-CoA hydratase/carnithine racemase